jgi:hypothetical protein
VAKEAYAKSYAHLYVIGFAIQPTARELIEKCAEVVGVPATYVQATPDLLMGDLLKNMRSSQIFSVCGLPEVQVSRLAGGQYQVKLLGLDVFDPVTMDTDTRDGSDVPCWLLDTDYNDLCFHVCQAFFPRTGAWENLKRALRGEYDESVWAHLAGTTSAPFEPGENRKIAVKVIDDRGNELLVVKELKTTPAGLRSVDLSSDRLTGRRGRRTQYFVVSNVFVCPVGFMSVAEGWRHADRISATRLRPRSPPVSPILSRSLPFFLPGRAVPLSPPSISSGCRPYAPSTTRFAPSPGLAAGSDAPQECS